MLKIYYQLKIYLLDFLSAGGSVSPSWDSLSLLEATTRVVGPTTTEEKSTCEEMSGPALYSTVVNSSLTVQEDFVDKIVETDGRTLASDERTPAVATETTTAEVPGRVTGIKIWFDASGNRVRPKRLITKTTVQLPMKSQKDFANWGSNHCIRPRINHVIVGITEISLISADKSSDCTRGRSSIVNHGKENDSRSLQGDLKGKRTFREKNFVT